MQDQTGTFRLVPLEQVVVDLHDDEAAGRERDTGPLRGVVHAVPGCPGREPRRVRDLGERGAGQGRLAETGPPLVVAVVGFRLLARLGGTRNKMAWWTSRLFPSLGWKSLYTIIELLVTWGLTSVQW